ncbi:MAG: hypothetical protein II625_08110 [Bacilli bacterium]|nr:hypothetical protein [Bacilli bacterium]
MNSVYRRVAKDCLVNWMGTPEEEAIAFATNDTVQDLENGNDNHYGVGALGSIRAAMRSIVRQLGLPDNIYSTFENAVVNDDNSNVFGVIAEKMQQVPNIEELIINALSDIHDQWVIDNSSEKTFTKKEGRGQLHQYTPLELIGWKEVKSDLIFLEPVLNAVGVTVDREKLLAAYNERVMAYAEERGITSKDDIATLIGTGSGYYPALPQELAGKLVERKDVIADGVVAKAMENNSPLLEVIGLGQTDGAPTLK